MKNQNDLPSKESISKRAGLHNSSALPDGDGLPNLAGLGLKAEFYDVALELSAEDIWFEIHPENYMVDGGARAFWLDKFIGKFAISLHGIGASLGGVDTFDKAHIQSWCDLIERVEPAQISEHATWSSHNGVFFADLLPVPRSKAVLEHMVNRIDEFQNLVGRRILIENPANYMQARCELDEPEFLVEIAKRAGCGLLMDINNIYVSEVNVGVNAKDYISKIPSELVGEIHMAGHDEDCVEGASLLIDTHAATIIDPVWDLLQFAITQMGNKPVLIERDDNIPPLSELLVEHERASQILGHQVSYQNTKQNALKEVIV